jgi:hypothetical protein
LLSVLDAIPSVVRLVAIGSVSWPAIVAAISGGVVGLAGIGSTIWVATRSIGAEDKRVRLAEKRQVYARCQASIERMIGAAISERANRQHSPKSDRRPNLEAEVDSASEVMLAAMSELRLLAPADIRQLTGLIGHNLLAYLADTAGGMKLGHADRNGVPEMQRRLLDLMRADLGEPD